MKKLNIICGDNPLPKSWKMIDENFEMIMHDFELFQKDALDELACLRKEIEQEKKTRREQFLSIIPVEKIIISLESRFNYLDKAIKDLNCISKDQKEVMEDKTDDPWQHRSKKMRCETCMWFVIKGGLAIGRCRKNAPTMTGYPVVYTSDWCGQHKLNEEVK